VHPGDEHRRMIRIIHPSRVSRTRHPSARMTLPSFKSAGSHGVVATVRHLGELEWEWDTLGLLSQFRFFSESSRDKQIQPLSDWGSIGRIGWVTLARLAPRKSLIPRRGPSSSSRPGWSWAPSSSTARRVSDRANRSLRSQIDHNTAAISNSLQSRCVLRYSPTRVLLKYELRGGSFRSRGGGG
jgi:hypothetical protein